MRDRRWRWLAHAGGVLYALFLLTADFEHHDLACHLKTPLHCTSCVSSLVGSNPDRPAILAGCHLDDAGVMPVLHSSAHDLWIAVRLTGRSPPTLG